jgi:hypothetical protein
LVTISERAFWNNDRLTGLEIPAGVTSIGGEAFYCLALTNIYFRGNAPVCDYLGSVGSAASAYYIPGTAGWSSTYHGIPTRPWIQFSYTTNASNTITLSQYTGVSGKVVLPATVNGLPLTSIAPGAFAGLAGLTSITLPNSVTSIGAAAFQGCGALTNAQLGNGVISIGANAFASCSALMNITIPNSVTAIGSGAFQYCQLTNVNFGTGLTALADRLFYNCGLQEVTIPTSVTSIGVETFAANYLLRTVIIPGGVASVAAKAFEECRSLAAVYFQGNAPVSDGTAFSGAGVWASGGTSVRYLPRTTSWGNSFAQVPTALLPLTFVTNNGLITITRYEGGGHVPIFSTINGLPVTAIAGGAFQNRPQLTGVHIPQSELHQREQCPLQQDADGVVPIRRRAGR